jgi:hypothetical protein
MTPLPLLQRSVESSASGQSHEAGSSVAPMQPPPLAALLRNHTYLQTYLQMQHTASQ